jgi:Ca2+-binding EF-hand superfamily protein
MGGANRKYRLTSGDIRQLSKQSGMREDDIKLRFQQFCQKYPKGKIPKAEYVSALSSFYSQSDSAKLEDHIARAYDTDGDGWIDFKEFLTVLFIFSGGTPTEKLTRVFRVFDSDDDGSLTREEVLKVVKDLFHLLGNFLYNQLKVAYVN